MDREIYVKQDPAKTRLQSGLIIPLSSQEDFRENIGTIVNVSTGNENEPMQFKIGDKVKYDPHAGKVIDFNGEETIVMLDTDVYFTF